MCLQEWAGSASAETRRRGGGAGLWARWVGPAPASGGTAGSKMATTKRVLYVGEQAQALGAGWANPIQLGAGVGSEAKGGEQLSRRHLWLYCYAPGC